MASSIYKNCFKGAIVGTILLARYFNINFRYSNETISTNNITNSEQSRNPIEQKCDNNCTIQKSTEKRVGFKVEISDK